MEEWEIKIREIKPHAEYIHCADQMEAIIAIAEKRINFLHGIASNDPFDLKYLYDVSPCQTICPYSKTTYLCPLENRLKCPGITCTDWLNNAFKGDIRD